VNILLVKLSSLGDVVHTLPALSDARRLRPQLRFAWVVEENLTEVAAWHGAVAEVIPIALRRWRRDGFFHSRAELADFARNLRRRSFDLALDAQGLIKSGIVSALAQGERVGYDRRSARESAAALFYQKRIAVDRERHAIDRIRRLFAAAFDWPAPVDAPDFGITPPPAATETITDPRGTVVFLHATTWRDKHWPQARWRQLAALADEHNCRVVLPWGNALEQKNAHAIAAGQRHARALPRRLGLAAMARFLQNARAVVSVDTGLGHLAAALGAPCVGLFGPTRPARAGLCGARVVNLRADSGRTQDLSAAQVWGAVARLVRE